MFVRLLQRRMTALFMLAIAGTILIPGTAVASQTVYRFYNATAGTHFFTASETEMQQVRDRLSSTFHFEGPVYRVPSVSSSSASASQASLYRFFNLRNGSHFYTVSEAERDQVRTELASVYQYEGPAYEVYTSAAAGTCPVHRFYNIKNGSHFYTMCEAERQSVEANLSQTYHYEGIAFHAAACQQPEEQPEQQPINIIIMIGDGMGYEHELVGDYYLTGTAGTSFPGMDFTSGMTTYPQWGSYDPAAARASFGYVNIDFTDSAAAATAMSTGTKTSSGRVGCASTGEPLRHLSEAAEDAGMATGVVTSVVLSHATPGAFVAHNTDRNAYSQIAEEMVLQSATDVIMGAGNPWYCDDGTARTAADYTYIGEPTWAALVAGTPTADADADGDADAWTLVQSRAEIGALATGETPSRVCAVPQVFSTLQKSRPGESTAAPFETPLTPGIPTLAEMARAALNVLDEDPEGFVLMIEGGAIDPAAHINDTGRFVEEQVDFVEAVAAVDAWVTANSSWDETLLIVTADHETGYLTGPGSGDVAGFPVWNPVVNCGPGTVPGIQWNSANHTNSLVPFHARGASACRFAPLVDGSDPVRGAYIDNTDISIVCLDLIE